ncbi:transglutaminase family protein [Marinobacter sp. CHS3-4]|uniref:transglutaminase family protein n=1 Tax=Marinobacter sp. CHS3-4 TaxID=3045174 RepID=UPI0024B4C5D7|nr:transglutaminase family protein [Marinobacter sp. CHS3-4]MDI9244643.1 transglutaminase family protein [Marinobacter sp. CHS3-4]
MWMRATCSIDLDIRIETPFIFMLRPRSGWQQWIGREQYLLTPSVQAVEFTDSFGNLCQRLVAPPGHFSVKTSFDVKTADSSDTEPDAPFIEVQQLPDDTLPFLLPSRYCESDRCTQLASSIVAGRKPGYDQCHAISEYIRRTIQYTPGEGQEIISAWEVSQRSQAVCRDMSHLAIACCRALSIPARLVVGYFEKLQPMDLHAWFEAFVGGRWYAFDPTQSNMDGGRIVVAYGRDAADVAIYTQFGEPVEMLNMQVGLETISGPS